MRKPPFGKTSERRRLLIFFVGSVIYLLNFRRKSIRYHFLKSVLVSVGNGGIIIPALEFYHVKSLLKVAYPALDIFLLTFEKLTAL